MEEPSWEWVVVVVGKGGVWLGSKPEKRWLPKENPMPVAEGGWVPPIRAIESSAMGQALGFVSKCLYPIPLPTL